MFCPNVVERPWIKLVDNTKEMLDLLYMLMWEQFKSWLNERFTPHRQVFKDSMELLELQQGERPNSLAKCVQKFNANMTFVLINKSLRRN
jgi:hypothetical protein